MDEYEFALCLTHDIDRTYKTFQAPYYTLKERDPSHLRALATSERPYWQFEGIMALEEELGVRSSCYFLNEQNLFRDKNPREWVDPENWKLFTGRYDITDGEIVDVIRELDRGGWEIGLHGSYESFDDPDRLRWEKEQLESILGDSVLGGRQHYLNLERPETWEYQSEIGLRYDSSLGSSTEFGFDAGYDPYRPFDDSFVVFPLTAMEVSLFDDDGTERAKRRIDRLFREAAENDAVMTVLWHLRYFNENEFPGYKPVYEYLIDEALSMGAWVGPCGEYYEMLSH